MERKAVVTGASLVAVLILSFLTFAMFFPELSTTFLPPSMSQLSLCFVNQ